MQYFSLGKTFQSHYTRVESCKADGDWAHLSVSLQVSSSRSEIPGGFPNGNMDTLMLSVPKGWCLVGHGGEVVTGAVWGLARDGGAVRPRLHISRSEHR